MKRGDQIVSWLYGCGVIVSAWIGSDGVKTYLVSFPGFGRVVIRPHHFKTQILN